jgi:hypothetical protein
LSLCSLFESRSKGFLSFFFFEFQISLSPKIKLEPKSEPCDGEIDVEDNFIDVENETETNRRTELGDEPEDYIPEPEKSKPKRQFSEPRKRRKNSVVVKKVQLSENGNTKK